MTRRLKAEEQSRLSEEWDILSQGGEAPERDGRSVEEEERDKSRKRRRMPTEGRRAGRKISPTLSLELIAELKAHCQELGYVNDAGEGIIASPVVEQLLKVALEALRRGAVVWQKEARTVTEWDLKWLK